MGVDFEPSRSDNERFRRPKNLSRWKLESMMPLFTVRYHLGEGTTYQGILGIKFKPDIA